MADLTESIVKGSDLIRLANAHLSDSNAVHNVRESIRQVLTDTAAELSSCIDAVTPYREMLVRFAERVVQRSSALRKSDADSNDSRSDANAHFASGVASATANDHQTARHHFELALRTVNEAVALAEADGEAYALAIANRAAVLAKLSLPELATRDCVEALALPALPAATRAKVQDRLRLIAADSPAMVPLAEMPVSFQNKRVDAARNESLGRHVVVTEALPSGATVLCEQLDGGLFALDNKHLSRYCCRCLRRLIAVFPCAGCTLARYCSPQCRAAQPHRLCEKFAALTAVMPTRALLAVNVLLAGRPVPQVLSHWRRIDPDIVTFHSLFATAASLLLSVSPVALLDIALAAETNVHSVVDHPTSLSRQVIGMALGADLANAFNHSCDPNCTVTWRGSTLTISTLRAVAPGEQLTLSYGAHFVHHPNVAARRAHLQACYFFECNCSACERGDADDERVRNIVDTLAQLEREERELPSLSASSALQVHAKRAQTSFPSLFGDDSLQTARALAAWAHALARVADWTQARSIATRSVAALKAFGVAGDPELSEMYSLLSQRI